MKITQTDTLKTIHKAVGKFTDFIRPTYGPAGKKVLVMNSEFDIQAIDDGYKGSESFEIENEIENAVVMYQKEVARKMNYDLGDGRATSILLTGAIVKEVLKDIESPYFDKDIYHKVLEIRKATDEAIKHIKDKAKAIKTKAELYKIAYNSFNNEEIATLISDTIFKIGSDGVIAVEDSPTPHHEMTVIEGLEIEKGVVSKEFFNVDKKEEMKLDEPAIVLIHKRIDLFTELFPIVKQLEAENKNKFIIIADSFSDEVIYNVILGRRFGLQGVLIETPGYGDDKLEHLKDIASITGATVIDNKTIKIADFNVSFAGTAKKVSSTRHKSVIIGGDTKGIDKRVALLESQLDMKNMYEKDKLKKRIASLKGGIALLKIGAYTDNEQKAIKAKASDAVNATKTAFKDGVVKGGGKTYAEIKTSSETLNNALKFPLEVLKENGERYLDDNVTDPAGILIGALETASSIACGLLTIGPISALKRKQEKE